MQEWDKLPNVVKLRILEAESTVLVGLLLEHPKLINMIKAGEPKERCLEYINENF